MDEILNTIHNNPNIKNELMFVKFKYPEIKDLLKHFLTLISASLVFSITFSEKIVNFTEATFTQKATLFSSWGVLIIALGACGLGIYTNYLAAERALERISGTLTSSFEKLAASSYLFQDIAGGLFGLGMVLLVVSAIIK